MNSVSIVLEFTGPEKLIPAVEKLESNVLVERCDPVLGHAGDADLVLCVRGADEQKLSSLLQLDGLKRKEIFEIADGEEPSLTSKGGPISAYVFIDTEPSLKESVRRAVLALPETVFCARMAAKCDLTALVAGESLFALKQLVREKLQMLEGVLRLKPYYLINLKEL
jgi:DNA-binding Lrp family transcriptional regulator